MEQSKTKEIAAFCLGIVFIGCLIQAAGNLKGDALVFPGVKEILRAFLRLLATKRTYLLIWTTLKHLLASMAIATVVGLATGLVQGMSDFVNNLFKPLITMLRSLPMIVLIVIIMVLAKYKWVPIIAPSLVLVPVISEATNEGIRRIDRELLDVYRLHSRFNWSVFVRVYLPLMAGYLKQAYINAVGMGIKLTISTEYLVQTRNSLGKAVHSSSYFNEYQDIYAYALVMILLVLLVSELPMWIGRRLNGASQKQEEKSTKK
jgi:NitT/TauT family transport system permease protein